MDLGKIRFDNMGIGLCTICDRYVEPPSITCSKECHEELIRLMEEEFGKHKKVVDSTTGIAYNVPTREIIEKGLKWEDLSKYPLCQE